MPETVSNSCFTKCWFPSRDLEALLGGMMIIPPVFRLYNVCGMRASTRVVWRRLCEDLELSWTIDSVHPYFIYDVLERIVIPFFRSVLEVCFLLQQHAIMKKNQMQVCCAWRVRDLCGGKKTEAKKSAAQCIGWNKGKTMKWCISTEMSPLWLDLMHPITTWRRREGEVLQKCIMNQIHLPGVKGKFDVGKNILENEHTNRLQFNQYRYMSACLYVCMCLDVWNIIFSGFFWGIHGQFKPVTTSRVI